MKYVSLSGFIELLYNYTLSADTADSPDKGRRRRRNYGRVGRRHPRGTELAYDEFMHGEYTRCMPERHGVCVMRARRCYGCGRMRFVNKTIPS
ncbi:hypothetical protein EVAR_8212_1 [Eumeta japonica]|uniref:Uncharacterized protein n=1 Tax=Eumeta variegata TaxID=151549 RepID=A0A4C1TFJ1_EUMVA|nr:hypothetical protein EVAR_8212_1 [Eumeta japonica]